ncbi:multicopper oxidase family protein [Actinophytocola sp. KF-1]
MSLSRRGFLGVLGGAALGATTLGSLVWPGAPGQTAELLRSRARLPEPFTVPLPVPPAATPVRDGHYVITQREAAAEILPGLRTPILGYDGIFPGPTIVSRRGQRTVVTHRNELSVPTVVHLHGGHTPADSDGYPTDLLLPRGWHDESGHSAHGTVAVGQRDYVYPCEQRAATLWYHDHRMDFTGPQVYRGLAGFHLVHDDEEDALPLPRGERDIPLMITDRAFDEDGSFRYPSLDQRMRVMPGVEDAYMEGVLGDVVLVNGAPWPELEVATARYRLRLLNASNARRYRLSLPGLAVTQIGSDGGLLAAPVTHEELTIAPGERFDVVVDFSGLRPGTEITMANTLGSGTTAHVMRFRVTSRVRDDSRVPARLSEIERLDPARAVRTREWRFTRGDVGGHGGWLVNDAPFDPARIDADVTLGEVEVWRVVSDLHHPVHVHLDPCQVVARDGDPPEPADGGWKDTVDVRPNEYVDLAVRFTDHAGRYMLHCHNLEHEDMAMMSTFRTS